MPITPITTTVIGNEKAWTYLEVNLQSPGNHGFRRYRLIVVKRDGLLAEYREDMGDARKFKGVKQLNIPSMFEHSCDELISMAEELRNETEIDLDDLLQMDNYKLA